MHCFAFEFIDLLENAFPIGGTLKQSIFKECFRVYILLRGERLLPVLFALPLPPPPISPSAPLFFSFPFCISCSLLYLALLVLLFPRDEVLPTEI